MTTATKSTITVSTRVDAPVEKVWELFTTPKHITQWYNASPDWFAPRASNDLRIGGKFLTRMEAVDGSFGFDMEGTYLDVIPHEKFVYEMGDGRKVTTTFKPEGDKTVVTQEFDPEQSNPLEMQEQGWKAILDNFNRFVEYTKKYPPLSFSIDINAPRTNVWNMMTDEKTYSKWVDAAWPNSFYEGSWKEGEHLLFLGKDNSGTKAKLVFFRPYEISLAEHVAMIDKGKEIVSDELGWVGSKELYLFTEERGKTTLEVVMYITPNWHEMFSHDWPKALAKLKELCES